MFNSIKHIVSIIFILSIYFCTTEINGQYDFKAYKNLINLEKINIKKIDSIILLQSSDSVQLAKINFDFSRFFYKNKNLSLAIKYSKKQLNILENLNVRTKHYHNSVYLLGKYYMLNKEIDNAILYYKKASILQYYYPKKTGLAFCQLGNCYRFKGDLYTSKNYLIKGLDLLENNLESYVTHCINLSLTCNEIKTKKSSKIGIAFLKLADSIVNIDVNSKIFRKFKTVNSCIAALYTEKENFNFTEAKKYYQKVLNQSIIDNDIYYQTITHLNMGELYLNKKNDSAILFLNKSAELNKRLKGNLSRFIYAECYRNIANYYLNKKELKKSLLNIQKSINGSFDISSYDLNNIKHVQYINVRQKRYLVKALKTNTRILLSLPNKNTNFKDIFQIIKISEKLTKLILEDTTEQETQFLWRNDVSDIYALAIKAAYLKNDPELLFTYLEKNKAFLLTQSINDNNSSLTLPNHIVNEQLSFKKRILNLEDKIDRNQSKKLQDSIFDIKFSYQRFQDSIKQVYPQHFESKNKVQTTSLSQTQQQLDKNTAVVSYSVGKDEDEKSTIYGLLITKNNSTPFKVHNPKITLENLSKYKKLVSKPLQSNNDFTQLNKVAYYLYDNLFPSEEIKNVIKSKQLIIIPDNELQNTPFEAFSIDKENLKYLIESNDISYAYSVSFLNFNTNIQRQANSDLTSFAPINFHNRKLNPLVNSKNEIDQINSIVTSDSSFLNEKASKDNFLTKTTDSKIIHLATHANAGKKPVIYFQNDSLKLHELYTYKNNADLVVLSACETNLGELKKGEGVLSLARGFFYSGANSVISSLWKINDASTSSIMKNFYSNLKKGNTKVKALNTAKREYLKSHSLSEKAPYYWASFVLLGNTDNTFESNQYWYYALAILLLLITSFLFVKRLKR